MACVPKNEEEIWNWGSKFDDWIHKTNKEEGKNEKEQSNYLHVTKSRVWWMKSDFLMLRLVGKTA